MRSVLIVIGALVGAIIVGVFGVRLLQPSRPLLADVNFSLSRISPNADGIDDVTLIKYTLSRSANLTISFKNKATDQIFYFRKDERRAPDSYEVYFSGVVDGYTLPTDDLQGQEIETRLIPDGDYVWTMEASADNGEIQVATGTLTIANSDSKLPLLQGFNITPKVLTPNQDGYDDRIAINLSLPKDAHTLVWLEGKGIGPIYISERAEGNKPDLAGPHTFDYDGGVDNELKPPPDGDYTIVAQAQDKVGQRVRRTEQISIKDGGLPQAEIIPQSTGATVTWTTQKYDDAFYTTNEKPGKAVAIPPTVTSTQVTISLPQGDLLLFKLTVNNYGSTPLRTIGPWPGTVYQYDQTNGAMESSEAISGAWRVGIQCERSETNYPWRWAIGPQESLTRVDRDGEVLWYLPPGKQSVVWGAMRMTKIIKTRNPQKCYAALIHEDVIIPNLQGGVGAIDVKLTTPNTP